MIARTTWILVADGAHARVLETVGVGHKLLPVARLAFETELPPSRDLGSGQPGRVHDSMGQARHAVGAKTDPHRSLKRSFAQTVADRLDSERAAGAFDRLVIVAPPVTLGDLRQCLSKAVIHLVAAEVAKDLVKTPNDQIKSHIADVVAV